MHFRGESITNGGECAGWSYFQLIFLLMLTWTPMKSFFRKLRINIHEAWLNVWALSINCVGLCSKLMDKQHLFYCPLIWVLWELGFGKTCVNVAWRHQWTALVSIKAQHTCSCLLSIKRNVSIATQHNLLHQSLDCQCMSKAKISKGCSLILVVFSFFAICCMHFFCWKHYFDTKRLSLMTKLKLSNTNFALMLLVRLFLVLLKMI